MKKISNFQSRRFIVVTVGTVGDLFPFLPIALALQRRGHSVTLMCSPIHRDYVNTAGIDYSPLGTEEQYLSIINNPDIWHSHKGVTLILKNLHHSIEPLLQSLRRLPDQTDYVVLSHPLMLPALEIARSGMPTMKIIAAYLAPVNLRTVYDPLTIGYLRIPTWLPKYFRSWLWKKIDSWIINPAVLSGINRIRHMHGLPAINNFINNLYSIPDLSITLFPALFANLQPDWPSPLVSGNFQLYDPNLNHPLSQELMQFLASGAAPIVFTAGTGNRHAAKYFELAMNVCHRLGKRAIFLTLFGEQLPKNLPDTILWQQFTSLRLLLPRVTAIVHHGGIGTTAEAMQAGTPQLVIPLAHDQFDNGLRVKALGIGDVLIAGKLRLEPFLKKLQTVVAAEDMANNCRFIAAEVAKNENMNELCAAIESV